MLLGCFLSGFIRLNPNLSLIFRPPSKWSAFTLVFSLLWSGVHLHNAFIIKVQVFTAGRWCKSLIWRMQGKWRIMASGARCAWLKWNRTGFDEQERLPHLIPQQQHERHEIHLACYSLLRCLGSILCLKKWSLVKHKQILHLKKLKYDHIFRRTKTWDIISWALAGSENKLQT